MTSTFHFKSKAMRPLVYIHKRGVAYKDMCDMAQNLVDGVPQIEKIIVESKTMGTFTAAKTAKA